MGNVYIFKKPNQKKLFLRFRRARADWVSQDIVTKTKETRKDLEGTPRGGGEAGGGGPFYKTPVADIPAEGKRNNKQLKGRKGKPMKANDCRFFLKKRLRQKGARVAEMDCTHRTSRFKTKTKND